MSPKMRIMVRAVKIRMNRGEDLESILSTYPRLSMTEREEIRRIIRQERESV